MLLNSGKVVVPVWMVPVVVVVSVLCGVLCGSSVGEKVSRYNPEDEGRRLEDVVDVGSEPGGMFLISVDEEQESGATYYTKYVPTEKFDPVQWKYARCVFSFRNPQRAAIAHERVRDVLRDTMKEALSKD